MIVLASHCSVKDAQALKTSLCKYAKEDAPVTVDVRAVERVDTATMQLLCAFVRERAARQQKVEWLGESRALDEAARLLGLTSMLGLGADQAAGGSA
ncbi:MAG TPA: STAS domain-containing protein [Steroidobacter sp.]